MSISVQVDVQDNASQLLGRLEEVLRPRQVHAVLATAVKNLVQTHLVSLPPNKLGFPTTHFYGRAAKATHSGADEKAGTVTVSQIGIRQRFYGGDIHPKGGRKYLTLPAIADAYGKTAREFDGLVFRYASDQAGHMRPALVQGAHSVIKWGRKGKDGTRSASSGGEVSERVMFWLVRSVHQDPDPSVMPSAAAVHETAMQAIRSMLARARQ